MSAVKDGVQLSTLSECFEVFDGVLLLGGREVQTEDLVVVIDDVGEAHRAGVVEPNCSISGAVVSLKLRDSIIQPDGERTDCGLGSGSANFFAHRQSPMRRGCAIGQLKCQTHNLSMNFCTK